VSAWEDYLESVQALASMPGREQARRRRVAGDEATAVAGAKAELASQLRRCREWEQLAARTQANAEGQLVHAKVLLPDPASAPPPPGGSPEQLAEALLAAERDLAADLGGLAAARKAADRRARDEAASAVARAARRRQLLTYGGIALVALVLLVALLTR
jgi:hypothetical protein